MRDYFGEIAAVIVTAVVLFLVPAMYLGIKQDTVEQGFVYAKVTDFVENVQENGYISQEMYNELTKQLGLTGLIFDITMEHVHPVAYPIFNSNGTAVTATAAFDKARYEDEILDTIYSSNGVYRMEAGDYFTITVANRTKTAGQNALRLLTGSSSRYAIFVTYGGRVRNENY